MKLILLKMRDFMMLVLIFGSVLCTKATRPSDLLYEENVYLHLSRTTLVAGESVFYKVYGKSNLSNPLSFLSKVVYVELLDHRNNCIIAQALHLKENTASSVLIIPDTTSTGMYTLKAYTNWMKNFREDGFYSQPIYIHNQYDDKSDKKSLFLDLAVLPEIYVSGGGLIDGVPACLGVTLPGYPGNFVCNISEIRSGNIRFSFTSNGEGYAGMRIIPLAGEEYNCSIGDSLNGFISVPLPEVSRSGYTILPLEFKNGTANICLYRKNLPPEDIKLIVDRSDEIIVEKTIGRFQDSLVVNFSLPQDISGILEMKLLGDGNRLLCAQPLALGIIPQIDQNHYPSRSKVAFTADLSGYDLAEDAGLSVSVHKVISGIESIGSAYGNTSGSYLLYTFGPDQILYLAKADFNSDSRGGRASGFINDIEYPVEDVGILFSGTINDHKGEKSVSDIEIMLAINDTLGNVICGHSDDNGHFTLLTNEWGTTEGYFTVYKRGVPLTNGYRIKMDPKFFYRGNEEIPGSDTPYHANNDFLEEMQEEAKRVLIEKAYNQNGHGFYNTITDSSMFPVGSFYVKPEIVVYPGIFFYLPNFEEIAREILPRVRYRHNKNGCELTVFHLEDNIQSTNPLVLVDGIPLDDPCDLYSLDSDDINRIEIQSGMRVSGNLVYNGLLAIYTTPKYRRGESKIPGKSVSIVLGYSNMPENFVYSLKEDDLEEERIPEFKNQLYWNPQLTIGEDSKAEFEFFTSDEEGSFMIEISGFDRKGYPIALKRIIQVKED